MVWSQAARQSSTWRRHLWGVRSEEATGKHVLNLDIGFPLDSLRKPLRTVMSDPFKPVQYETDCLNRRGRTIHCVVTCSLLRASDGGPMGVIVSVTDSEQTKS